MAETPIVSLLAQLLFTMPLSFLLSWVFLGSGGSVLIAVLMHGSFNGFNVFFERVLFPPLLEEDGWVLIYILIQLVAGTAAAFAIRRMQRSRRETA